MIRWLTAFGVWAFVVVLAAVIATITDADALYIFMHLVVIIIFACLIKIFNKLDG